MENNMTTFERVKVFFRGKRWRDIKEYMTAYAMISPAMILIFTFGIFPVMFAVYVSMHKWKIKKGDFVGISNYTKYIDNLAYLLFFAVAIGFAYLAWQALKGAYEQSKEGNSSQWLLTIPGALLAFSGFLFIRYALELLPEILGIADKVRGVKRTQELFIQLLKDAFQVEVVTEAWQSFITLFLIAVLVTAILAFILKNKEWLNQLGKYFNLFFFSAGAVLIAKFTVDEITRAITTAIETGDEPRIWVQIILIISGLLLWFFAWKLWTGGIKAERNITFAIKGLAAAFFLVGGWLLIGEIPMIIESGNKEVWDGLKVTVYYSMGTIPFQLSIGLVLAFLLFQNIRFKEFFRMVFFLPYITPAVASAAVFNLLFSPRPTAIINQFLGLFGIDAQKWLMESRGVFTIIANGMGVQDFPKWAEGPSLALVVIIIYSIWVYVGYDVVIYLAGLGNISNEVNEAAEIDGATQWQILRHITLPLLSPTIYFLSLIAVIGTFKAFNHIYVMRNDLALGTVDTFSVAIFDVFFNKSRYGYASAMAFILFAVILLLTYVNNKIQGSKVFYG